MTTPGTDFFLGYGEPNLPDPGGRLPVALLFPGSESLALSTLGWQIVYRLLASRPEFRVERFFAHKEPAASALSADSAIPLKDFPLVAASINFEEEILELARILEAGGISPRRAERGGYPLILVGGPLGFMNPAPMAPMADLFFLGEAESGLAEVMAELAGLIARAAPREEALAHAAGLPGVYVPGVTAGPVDRRLAGSDDRVLLDPGYSCFLSSRAQFRDMLLVEVNRGCPYGCRFCAAGFIYRPPRHARMVDLQRIVERTRPPKVGLVGTALTDWPELRPFLEWLAKEKIKFSLSSLRADGLSEELVAFLRRQGVRTLTLALEGPSKRIRDAANKRLAEEDLLQAVTLAAKYDVNRLKLYLIAGWPGETDEDYEELGRFLKEIDKARLAGRGKRKKGLEVIVLSVSPLVPKPWTPFQWAPMADEKQLAERVARVRELARPIKGLRVDSDSPFAARLQGLIARGDETLFELVMAALEKGSWRKGLAAWEGDPARFLDRERGKDEKFPWEIIRAGVSREFLHQEWERYKACRRTKLCPARGCAACGACGLDSWLAGPGAQTNLP